MNNKIIKFIINGSLLSFLNLSILNILYFLGLGYILSIICSYTITIIINYIISYKYIFIGNNNKKTFFNYIFSHFIGFTIFTIMSIYLFESEINIYLGQIIATLCSALINFIYNNYITFNSTMDEN